VANLNLGRTWAYSRQFEERLAALTAAEVNAALRKYVDPAKLTTVKAGDFTKK
jgi:zinc protease